MSKGNLVIRKIDTNIRGCILHYVPTPYFLSQRLPEFLFHFLNFARDNKEMISIAQAETRWQLSLTSSLDIMER